MSARNFPRNAFLSLLVCAAAPAVAGTTGVFLPPSPTGSGGEDSIETGSGARCRQSINSNGAYLDMGVTGTAAAPLANDRLINYGESRDREAMGYVRVTIPIGKRPERIDCSRLYEMELERLQREVEMLRIGVK